MSDLLEISHAIHACTRCELHRGRRNPVVGFGPVLAEVMIVTGVPRDADDRRGQPFAGDDGEMLQRMVTTVLKLTPAEVFLTTAVRCKLPSEGRLKPEYFGHCQHFLQRQIGAVGPRALIVMGAQAFNMLWPGQGGIEPNRGEWRDYCKIPAMPTFHPAYLLRHTDRKREVLDDLIEVRKRLDTKINPVANDKIMARNALSVSAENAALRQKQQDLLAQTTRLTNEITMLNKLLRQERNRTSPPPPKPALTDERITQLLRFVHPDRQPDERKEEGGDLTKWLLSQRTKKEP